MREFDEVFPVNVPLTVSLMEQANHSISEQNASVLRSDFLQGFCNQLGNKLATSSWFLDSGADIDEERVKKAVAYAMHIADVVYDTCYAEMTKKLPLMMEQPTEEDMMKAVASQMGITEQSVVDAVALMKTTIGGMGQDVPIDEDTVKTWILCEMTVSTEHPY